jgi:hypothetical protein
VFTDTRHIFGRKVQCVTRFGYSVAELSGGEHVDISRALCAARFADYAKFIRALNERVAPLIRVLLPRIFDGR